MIGSSPETLFYCDPPYWGAEDDCGAALFARPDFEHLSACLKGVKGQFILSLNDVPEVREIFSWAAIEPVELSYRLSSRPILGREVIIKGPTNW